MISRVLLLFLTGCAGLSVSQELDPKVYYKNDIKFVVNGMKGRGAIVVPLAKSYEIEITTPGKIDLIKITSCHRQVSTEDIPSGWFETGKKYKYTYTPNEPMENTGSCHLRVEAYEKGVEGRHSSGIIEFETPDEKLKARIQCNGVTSDRAGVSVCESWEGLVQSITFETQVKQYNNLERCRLEGSKDGKSFTFPMKNRECVYLFVSEDGQKHRMQTIGFEEVAIRSE